MIPHSRPTLGKEETAAALAVLRTGQIAQGERVTAFEKALAKQVGVGDAAAVSSGTAALQLSLLALGIGEGNEVVIVRPCSTRSAPSEPSPSLPTSTGKPSTSTSAISGAV